MVAGKRYYGEDVDFEEAKHFHEEKKLVKIKTKKEVIFRGLIDEHRSPSRALVNKNSMINHLLSMQKSEPEYYTDEIIKGHSLILILVGTETTATTIEWAMSLLLNRPDVMKKARVVELDTHDRKYCLMEESDFPKLQYLQTIISETLRLFPAAPVLVPHMSSDNCQIGGFKQARHYQQARQKVKKKSNSPTPSFLSR
ncbi:isoflavone 2'-hydroxylase-like [Vitis riparia]|uniref:isoflavone 2'-hydroxylase-like n=1 Tax=Vitis riparia TaxID=96939 RepID=UPI00155AD8F0|nr:isoflavone 2'-hydroxylase-like [Vitis riparia]